MIKRRGVLGLALLVAFGAAAQLALAQNYPDRLIRMIVPAPPGGQTDVLARYVGQHLQASLGQNIVIENRPGAGGGLGARSAATSDPDGHTLFFGNTSTLAVIPAVARNPGYDPVKNFAPVASVSESYMILVVHPAFPAATVQEFIAYAQANPGKLNFAHAGAGNVTHLTGEMFRTSARINFVNVPHKGGAESVTSVLGQQVDFALESPVILLPLIKEGKLRALAVTSSARKPELADIPTMKEGGADFVATLLTGVVAPAGTPVPIVARLNTLINASLKSAEMKATLARFGSEPKMGTPGEFAAFLAAETRKWAAAAKMGNVVVD